MEELPNLKMELLNHCNDYVNDRLFDIQTAMKEAQESANDDSKSSAGDKHETGRAMAQLEQEKLSKQLAENIKLQNTLQLIDLTKSHKSISLGSIVMTDKGNYFISISAGKVVLNNKTFFLVSSASPLGKELIQTDPKKDFQFNGQNYSIKKVIY